MTDERQAKLLEAYLAYLHEDRNAAPPQGLDPDLAAFARKLTQERSPRPDAATRQRMWHRALASTRGDGQQNDDYRGQRAAPMKETEMIAMNPTAPRGRMMSSLPLVAVFAVVALGVLLLYSRPPTGPGNDPAFAAQSDESETPIPTPTLVPSSTPVATLTFTPTPEPSVTPIGFQPVPPGATQVGAQEILPGSTPVGFQEVIPGATPVIVQAQAIQLQPTLVPYVQPTILRPIEFGAVVSGELTVVEPSAGYTFTVAEPGPVAVVVESPNIQQITLTNLQDAQVITPQVYAVQASGGTFSVVGQGSPVATSFVVVPDTPVTLVVSSISGTETGLFTLSLIRPDAEAIAYGDEAQGSISEDNPGGYYTFEGQQGEVVTLRAAGENGFDTQLHLYNPDMQLLAFDDDSGAGYDPEIFRYRLPQNGTYTVGVSPVLVTGGRFSFSLTQHNALALDDGPQIVSVNSKQDNDVTFNASAGETVTVNVRTNPDAASTTPQSLRVDVFQNNVLLSSMQHDLGPEAQNTTAPGTTLISSNVTASQDGPITLRLHVVPSLGGEEGVQLEVSINRD